MKIKDAVVLVTGANRGLGLAYARAALAAGAKKVYAAARDPKSVTLEGVTPIALDVTKPEQVDTVARELGDVTLVINNAGISRGSDLLSAGALDAAKAEFETNFYGPWAVSRAFAPVLAKNGGGAIVNVLSALAWTTFPSVATYSTTKSAAWSLTNGLRNELRAQGTQVLAVHVGYMDTDMAAHVDGAKTSPDDVAKQTFAGIESGQTEVLADEVSRQLKQGFVATPPAYAGS